MTEITWSDICVFPLHHPQISHDFDSSSNILLSFFQQGFCVDADFGISLILQRLNCYCFYISEVKFNL